MAITTSCCLNIPPPTSSPAAKNTSQLPWFKNEKWRSVGMACLVIGLEMGDSVNLAMAVENSTTTAAIESKAVIQNRRWSDGRMCPQWKSNSLETIVPENLPRPSSRRRWEATGYSKIAAPPAVHQTARGVMFLYFDDCFTM